MNIDDGDFFFVLFILRSVDEFQIVCHDVGDMQINDPVHEVEADETDGENDARIFVNVGRRESVQFVEIFTRRYHDGRGFFVDPRSVDDHIAVVDDGLTTDRRRHWMTGTRFVYRHRFPVRTHQESHLLFIDDNY